MEGVLAEAMGDLSPALLRSLSTRPERDGPITRLRAWNPEGMAAALAVLCEDSGVELLLDNRPDDVEVSRRSKDGTDWTFVLNHGSEPAKLPLRGLN